MKFIHTADWHLGNSMHDIDRREEAKQFLGWLRERIVEFGAECLVVAGDIFDTVNPPVEARRMYFRFLASLLDTCCKNIVLVGGNHDSGTLLDAPRDLLDALNIQMVGSMGDRSVEDLVKELTDGRGEVIGISAAVPYVREADLRPYLTEGAENFADSTYRGLYGAVYEAAEKLRAGREIPIVATGHLYAAKLEGRPDNDDGRDMKNHGVRDIVGNLGTVPVGVFPEGLDYVALGHIHYTTMVAKNPKVRYSGSPFVLGFDEAKMPHYILTVDLAQGQNPVVEKVEAPRYFEFRRLTGATAEIRRQLVALRSEALTKPVKLEIVYDYDPRVNVQAELEDVLEGENYEVVSWKSNRRDSLNAADFTDESSDGIEIPDERGVFKLLLMKQAGLTEADEQVEAQYAEYLPFFEQVLEEVEREG
ncbi:exonuclease subunit SbcD [Fibrobacter sp. UWH4]|uniref:exonuclease subunit SbcD n=1 Tax=Fibrobacter sp. UWH4 TaxID=1896210 RepID=UPI00091EECC0|nr:exonuclease subunit SbcD [Fibrobacter sp. UWH4]SHK65788.1 Exodeoxyribonuclease I subunit D [Fibrobacter sp. UWH4]